MLYCEWCGREIKSWYLKYDDKNFCENDNNQCLKEYLFDKADKDITEDRADGEVEYSMEEVSERDGQI